MGKDGADRQVAAAWEAPGTARRHRRRPACRERRRGGLPGPPGLRRGGL